MKVPRLFEDEKQQEKFEQLLKRLQKEAYLPYKNLNGGFAEVDVYDYDSSSVSVEIRSGYGGWMGIHMDKDLVKISMATAELIHS